MKARYPAFLTFGERLVIAVRVTDENVILELVEVGHTTPRI
jgi:hypothetical protein